jgi:predicted dehydrogenase
VTLIRGCQLTDDNLLPAEITGLENGGGALMAYGSHGLAGALSLFWPESVPTGVEAVTIAARHPDRMVKGQMMHLEVDDNAQIKVRMEDPATGSWSTVYFEATIVGGHIGLSPTHGGGQSSGVLQIIGDKGMIDTESSSSMTIKYWNGGTEEIPLIEYPGESISFLSEISEFCDAHREGRQPVYGAEFGAAVIAVCGAGYHSAKHGGVTTLESFKAYAGEFVERYGDTTEADDAVILDLLEPFRT